MEHRKLKSRFIIKNTNDVCYITRKWSNCIQENFLVITLDCKHEVKRIHHVTKGLLNKILIHPRECFYPAIRDYASSVIIVHNHPNSDERPSDEDDKITYRLCAAGNILGINIIDHVIITPSGKYYSYAKNGKIKNNFTIKEINKIMKIYLLGAEQ